MIRINGPRKENITKREFEVIRVIVDDCLSQKEAGAKLFIAEKTVETHLANVTRKLDLHSRMELAKWYWTKGIFIFNEDGSKKVYQMNSVVQDEIVDESGIVASMPYSQDNRVANVVLTGLHQKINRRCSK